MPDKTKANYSALIRWAFATGRERELISKKQRESIPRQSIYSWRRLSERKIVELEKQLELHFDSEELIRKIKIEKEMKIRLFKALGRFQLRIIESVGKGAYHKMLAQDKKALLDLVAACSEWIPVNQVLRFFQFNKTRYSQWISHLCGD